MGSQYFHVYTRRRPIIDDTTSHGIQLRGDPSWLAEDWTFDGASIRVRPYRFGEDGDALAAWHADSADAFEDPPSWMRELNWSIELDADRTHDLIDWGEALAAQARGVLLAPYSDDDAIVQPASATSMAEVALTMMRASRPWFMNDLQAEPLIRRDQADAPLAPTTYIYGADLSAVQAADIEVSRETAQWLYAYLVAAGGVGPDLRFSILVDAESAPVPPRWSRDQIAARVAALTSGPIDVAIEDLPDSLEVRNELIEFWERVIALDPMLDATELVGRPRYT